MGVQGLRLGFLLWVIGKKIPENTNTTHFGVWGSGFRVQGLGLMVWDLGFRVNVAGFGVQDLVFKV